MENNPSNQDSDQGDQRNQNPSGNAPRTQGLFGNTQGGQGLLGNIQGGQNLFGQGLFGNNQGGQRNQNPIGDARPTQGLFDNTQGGQGLFGNSEGGLGLFGKVQGGQNLLGTTQGGLGLGLGLLGNIQGGQGLFGNTQRGQGLFGNSQGGGLFSGLNRAQNSKQPIKELTEEEKAQYRMVSVLPEPRYGQLLWQETKKNKIFTHLTLHYESPLPKKSDRDPRKAFRRIYLVRRRKDIKKDAFSANGSTFPNFAKSIGVGVKHFRELEIKTQQHSDYNIMTNWLKIFHTADLSNIKTLKFLMESWYVLEANEGRFSILKSSFPNLENLHIVFRQLHGGKDIPLEDWTLNFIRRLRNLKTLRIEFSCCGYVKDEHLGVISKTLQSHLNSLESLELLFEGLSYYITSEAIQHLWASIGRIPNLKKLAVKGGFSQNKISEAAFATLCDVIDRKSAALVAVKVDDGCSEQVKSDSHQLLCKVLTNILPRLQSLELRFVSRESVSDCSLSFFGDLLSNGSPSLTKLNLEFGSHKYITAKGAKQLAEGMKKGRFPKMQSLVIYFHMTYKLTYYGLYDIADAIPDAFPNLKDLRFSYSGSHAETDAEVTAKANQMLKERLPNLSEQYLGW